MKEAAEMIRQAAVGLAHAHQHKLVHRDIKPNNLLLSKQGKVKILDLGLARLQGEAPGAGGKALTGFGMIMGTPDYMAPEQWEDLHGADHRADLYALGCTLFYLLTGHAPFDDAAHPSLAKKLAAHTAEAPPDLTKERPDVPAELNAIYRRLLAKEPNERFTSAVELARALLPIAKGMAPAPAAASPGVIAPAPGPAASGPAALPVDAGLESVLAAIANDAAPARPSAARMPTRKPAGTKEEPGAGRGLDQRKLWIAGGALAGALLLGGIFIKITTKDGTTTEVKVPPSSKVEITNVDDTPTVEPAQPVDEAADADPERRAAKWVQSVEGTLRIEPGGSINPNTPLPEGKFVVTQIHLNQRPKVTDAGMANLRGLKSVAVLSLYGDGQLTDRALEAISGMTALEDLNMQSVRASDEGLKHLAGMKNLKALNLTATPIRGTGFAALTELGELTNLRLADCPLDNAAMAHLKNFPKLTSLEIRNPQFNDEGLKGVAGAASLVDLALGHSQVTSDGLASLREMPKLESIGIWRGPVNDEGFKHLAAIKTLKSLGLSDLNLTGDGFKHFPADQIKSLSFWQTRLNDAGMKQIARFTQLERLIIEASPITETGMRELTALKGIREIQLKGYQIGAETAEALRKAHPTARLEGLAPPAAPAAAAPGAAAASAALDGIVLDPPVPLGTLDIGTDLPNTSQHHLVTELPQEYRGSTYTVFDGMAGRLKFRVTKPMTVRVAFWDSQWGGVGNAEGNWRPELKNQDDLKKDGWKEIARFKTNYAAEKIDYGWIIYERPCKADESFLLRNGKYRAPILIVNRPLLAVAPFDAKQARAHQEAWAKHLGVPVEYTNSLGMKFVLIPPGEFTMGTSDAEAAEVRKNQPGIPESLFDDERPAHRVRLTKPYYLSACEVTFSDFRTFVAETGFKTDAERGKGSQGYDPEKGTFPFGHRWNAPGFPVTDKHPVTNVSWADGVAFCEWLARKENRTCRYPTEAEWEGACRAGTTSVFFSGDTPASLEGYANVADAKWKQSKGAPAEFRFAPFDDGAAATSPVGRYKPNAFGLFDMHGNVWEWCQDIYDGRQYVSDKDLAIDPPGPQTDSRRRVARGGSWVEGPETNRSAERSLTSTSDNSGYSCGFRVAISIDTTGVAAQSSKPEVASIGASAGPTEPGLVGRILIDGKDSKILATYAPPKGFGHKNLKAITPLYDYNKQKIQIELSGVISLPAAEKLRIRHTGGSPKDGVATLFVGGQLLGSVGGEHDKETTYEPELAAGTHAVRWVLTGGWLGSSNLLELTGSDGRAIPVGHTDALLAAARNDDTKKQADLTGETTKAYTYAPARPPQFSWKVAAERPAVLKNVSFQAIPLDPSAANAYFPTVPQKFTDTNAVVYAGGQLSNTVTADVETDGFLFVGINHEYQGNSSGGWTETRWMPEQFVAAGWTALSERDVGGQLVQFEKRVQNIYYKFVRKGDKLKLQCNKYNPPYLIHFELPAPKTTSTAGTTTFARLPRD